MSSNLLPQTEKKDLRVLYHSHVLIISMWLFFFWTLLSFIMLIPSYLTFSHLNQRVLDEGKGGTEVVKEIEKYTLLLKDTEEKIKKLDSTNEQKVSAIIAQALSSKTSNILIDSIEFNRGGALLLAGIAKDREALNLFVKKLEADSTFSKVDSPISNLLGGKNIPFTIVLAFNKAK